MRNFLTKCILPLACLALILIPVPLRAQSSNVGISIGVFPATTNPGTTVLVSSHVTNNTSKKIRTTLVFTSFSACGEQTDLGDQTVSLGPGQTIFTTLSYAIPPDACVGMYTVSLAASTNGGKNSATTAVSTTATATLLVQ